MGNKYSNPLSPPFVEISFLTNRRKDTPYIESFCKYNITPNTPFVDKKAMAEMLAHKLVEEGCKPSDSDGKCRIHIESNSGYESIMTGALSAQMSYLFQNKDKLPRNLTFEINFASLENIDDLKMFLNEFGKALNINVEFEIKQK